MSKFIKTKKGAIPKGDIKKIDMLYRDEGFYSLIVVLKDDREGMSGRGYETISVHSTEAEALTARDKVCEELNA